MIKRNLHFNPLHFQTKQKIKFVFYFSVFCFLIVAVYTAEKSSSPLSSSTDKYCSLQAVVVGRARPREELNSNASL